MQYTPAFFFSLRVLDEAACVPEGMWVVSWSKRKKTPCVLMGLHTVMEPCWWISHMSGNSDSTSLGASYYSRSARQDLPHRASKCHLLLCPDILAMGVYLFLFICPTGLIPQVLGKVHRGKFGQGHSLRLFATVAKDHNIIVTAIMKRGNDCGIVESLALPLVSLQLHSAEECAYLPDIYKQSGTTEQMCFFLSFSLSTGNKRWISI